MKTLVVYHSFHGNCSLIAEKLKTCLGAETLEIKTVDEKKRKGPALFLWGGFQAMMKKQPPLKPYTLNPDEWDLIILGTPVWAGSPAPAMRSFLGKTALNGKKLALFCCHAGGMGKALEKLKALLPGNEVIGEIDFNQAKKIAKDELQQKVETWAKTLS